MVESATARPRAEVEEGSGRETGLIQAMKLEEALSLARLKRGVAGKPD